VQDLDEGFAKLDVEGGVDDGVDGAVEIPQPGDGAVQRGRDAAAAAVGLQHVGQEEGQPADDEHTLGAETGGGPEGQRTHYGMIHEITRTQDHDIAETLQN